MILLEDDGEPIDMKYITLLKQNTHGICTGSFVSVRHILTTGTCIERLIEKKDNINYILLAFIGQIEHRIIHTVYHDSYIPEKRKHKRYHDLGMAMVCILIICLRKVPIMKFMTDLCESMKGRNNDTESKNSNKYYQDAYPVPSTIQMVIKGFPIGT